MKIRAERLRELKDKFEPSMSGIGMFYYDGMELSTEQMMGISEWLKYTTTSECIYWLKSKLREKGGIIDKS
jgi:hypothetical protein